MKLILSFLGTGSYEQADYPLDGQIYSTPYTLEAIHRRYPDYALKVLLTEKAKQAHGQALLERVEYEPVDIPTGQNKEELWGIFNKIVAAVPDEARLIMDVSHGFRSQPILALAVLQLLQVVKRVQVERVLYGFFATDTKKADFFDLTAFLELMEWTQATRDLLEYGHGGRLRQLLRLIHKQSHLLEGPKARKLASLGDSLDGVGKALEFIRPREVLALSRRTLEHLEKVRQDVEDMPRSKPLSLLLGAIEERYKPLTLAETELFSKEGMAAMLHMVKLLLQTQSYAQALGLMRELVVSEVSLQYELDPIEDRKLVENMLNVWAKLHTKGKLEVQKHNLAKLWSSLIDARNDVMHAGMSKKEKLARTLAKSVDELYEEIRHFLA